MKIADRVNFSLLPDQRPESRSPDQSVYNYLIHAILSRLVYSILYLWRLKLFANNAQTLYIKKEFAQTTPKI